MNKFHSEEPQHNINSDDFKRISRFREEIALFHDLCFVGKSGRVQCWGVGGELLVQQPAQL